MEELVVNGIPAVLLVFGLVEFAKKFGVSGNALTALSAALGLVVSASYQLALSGVPTDYAGWLGVVVVGLAYGLTASGVYDFLSSRLGYN